MNILILSPLFPPDTGTPASYVKELADRLGKRHEVTLHIYGYLPEEVMGVPILATDKRKSLLFRLLSFTRTLFSHKRQFDLILVNNAPSIELPFLFFSLLRKTPYVLLESDPLAKKKSTRGFYKILHRFISKHAKYIIEPDEASYQKDEWLPFTDFDTAKEERRNTWWDTHLTSLTTV